MSYLSSFNCFFEYVWWMRRGALRSRSTISAISAPGSDIKKNFFLIIRMNINRNLESNNHFMHFFDTFVCPLCRWFIQTIFLEFLEIINNLDRPFTHISSKFRKNRRFIAIVSAIQPSSQYNADSAKYLKL